MRTTETRRPELCDLRLTSGPLVVLLYKNDRFFTRQQFDDGNAATIELPTALDAFSCYQWARKHGRIREPFPVPVADEAPDPPDESAPALPLAAQAPVIAPPDGGRRCRRPGCNTILSRFNEDDRCALHA